MRKIKTFLSGLVFLVFASTANAIPVVLDITFDDFPGETSFGLWADGADLENRFAGIAYDVAASAPIGFGDGYVVAGDLVGVDAGPWQFVWDLTPDLYTFILFDSFGDGICCGFGFGEYSLSVDGSVIATGGEFLDQDVFEFEIADVVTPVSAPSIFALLGLGIIGVIGFGRRKA